MNNFKFIQQLLFLKLVKVNTIICKSMVFANIFSFDLVRHNIFVEILALLADLRKAKRNCYHVCLSFLILKELYLDEVLLRFHKKFLSNLNHNVSRHCSLKKLISELKLHRWNISNFRWFWSSQEKVLARLVLFINL